MAKLIDLTGKVFGELTVIRPAGKDKRGNRLWRCKCSCGKEVDVRGMSLKRGSTRSCGHLRRRPYQDLTGQKFGELTVIGRAGKDESGAYLWHCKCSCGKEVDVRGMSLKRGSTRSCGHLRRTYEDLTGQKFGELTVLGLAGKDKRGNRLWHCKCSCGKEVDVRAGNLMYGNTKSCGHKRDKPRPRYDLTGQKFGELTVLGIAEKNQHGQIVWHCKCSCGKEVDVAGNSLHTGNTKSCGCQRGNRQPENLAGKRFGRLTVTALIGKRKGAKLWRCACDCGKEIEVTGPDLKKGRITSCGGCGDATDA